MRSRVLFLSRNVPWPALSGVRRREFELIKRIAERFDVHLLVVSAGGEPDLSGVQTLRHYCRELDVFAAAPSPLDAITVDQPAEIRRHRCAAATGRVGEILARGEADLVHVGGFCLMQHIPDWADVPTLLDEPHVEYDVARQCGGSIQAPGAVRGLIWTVVAERQCWTKASEVIVASAPDAELIHAALHSVDVQVVPDGADHIALNTQATPHGRSHTEPLIVMLANFGSAANLDAAERLVTDVLPVIREHVPDARLRLVGTDPRSQLNAFCGNGIELTGEVPDVVPYLDAADVIVCPRAAGGGVTMSLLEALRRGKAVVSTSLAMQGLPQTARRALSVVADERDLARQLSRTLLDSSTRRALERRATQAAVSLPTWDQSASALAEIYDAQIGLAASSQRLSA